MITIGTRGSKLAMVQAHAIAAALRGAGRECAIQVIKTKGDMVMDRFDKIEGKGFFTAEIEQALLEGAIDLAVHCLKDLPTMATPGLVIGAICEREDPGDLLISKQPLPCDSEGRPDLRGKKIGTSSMRRVLGLTPEHGQTHFEPIRGNVPTRIAKMERGEVDVVVLACAGVNRLGLDLTHLAVHRLSVSDLVPAPGQGALALQTRAQSDLDLTTLHHEETARCVAAERRVLAVLEGGCQLPFGMLVRPDSGSYVGDLFLAETGRPPFVWRGREASPELLAERALECLATHRS